MKNLRNLFNRRFSGEEGRIRNSTSSAGVTDKEMRKYIKSEIPKFIGTFERLRNE